MKMIKCYCCNTKDNESVEWMYYLIEQPKGLRRVYLCWSCDHDLYDAFSTYQKQWIKDHKYKAVGKIPMDTEEK